MAKKSQLDRAVEALEAKKADILSKSNAEVAALEHAILTLKAQRVKARVSRPRAVAAVEEVG